jgi:hypothetical protein
MPTKTNSPLHIAPALIGMGVKGLVGGFGEVLRDRKEAKDAGEKYSFKESLGDFVGGAATGMTGMDFTDQREAEEQPTYKTNIDPMTGEEILPNQDLVNKYGIPMTGKPLKMLTGIKGNIPHNMSAAQYKSALKMSEISGASSLMFTEEGLNKLPNDIPGEFGDIVRKEKTEQQQKNK